ncbi:MAG: ACT domain-containing protein [Rhizobiaceae bacterium]
MGIKLTGETDLNALLRTMKAKLVDGVFVFVAIDNRELPTGLEPRMIFQEAEGTTLVLLKTDAEAYDLDYEFPCRMITLEVHSALEAVGFLARITTELAKCQMGVNPVSGFFHDHLFVPDGREQDALSVLDQIAAEIE